MHFLFRKKNKICIRILSKAVSMVTVYLYLLYSLRKCLHIIECKYVQHLKYLFTALSSCMCILGAYHVFMNSSQTSNEGFTFSDD